LLRLDDVDVTAVEWFTRLVVGTVVLRRRRLWCPRCGHKTSARYDTRPVASRWRHLDLGLWQVEIRAVLRRLAYPRCRGRGGPLRRPGVHLTRDFDDLLAWLATDHLTLPDEHPAVQAAA
jgi:transposase